MIGNFGDTGVLERPILKLTLEERVVRFDPIHPILLFTIALIITCTRGNTIVILVFMVAQQMGLQSQAGHTTNYEKRSKENEIKLT
jgi:hypothetical protein